MPIRNSDLPERVSTTARRNGMAPGPIIGFAPTHHGRARSVAAIRRDDFPLDGLDSLGLAAGIFQKLEAGRTERRQE